MPGNNMMTPVGLTSRWMAANRALESESPDPLFHDPLARPLAGEEGFALQEKAAAYRAPSGPPSSEPDAYTSIRTRFFDDALLDAVAGVSDAQVVLLAAGMDARAYRMDWPAGTTFHEIDRPEVLDHKETVLRALDARPRCARRVVPADLGGDWVVALLDTGFDPDRPAAFLAEGLLVYLEEPMVNGVFEELQRVTGPGSWLGLDLVDTSLLRSPYMKPFLDALDGLGCGWRFGTPEPEALLARHGWSATVAMPGEPAADFGRWPFPVAPRDMPDMPRSYLVTARRADANRRKGVNG